MTCVLVMGTQKNLSALGTVFLHKDNFIYNVFSLLILSEAHRKICKLPEDGITVHRGICSIDQPRTWSFIFFSLALISLYLSLILLNFMHY